MSRLVNYVDDVDSLEDITISIITEHELIVGARNQRNADAIDSLIEDFPMHREINAYYAAGVRTAQTLREVARLANLRGLIAAR